MQALASDMPTVRQLLMVPCLCVKVGMLAGLPLYRMPVFPKLHSPQFRLPGGSDGVYAWGASRCEGGAPHLLTLATRVDQHRWRVSLDIRRTKTKYVQVVNLV